MCFVVKFPVVLNYSFFFLVEKKTNTCTCIVARCQIVLKYYCFDDLKKKKKKRKADMLSCSVSNSTEKFCLLC